MDQWSRIHLPLQEWQVWSGSGRSHGGGNGKTLQYSCLANLMDRGAWRAIVHVIARVRCDWATTEHQYWILPIFTPKMGLMPGIYLGKQKSFKERPQVQKTIKKCCIYNIFHNRLVRLGKIMIYSVFISLQSHREHRDNFLKLHAKMQSLDSH